MSAGLKTPVPDPYSALVRQHFLEPGYCGDISTGDGTKVVGDAGNVARGAAVRLAARIGNGRVLEMRFRAFGCPYLVAALDITCADSEGRKISELQDFSAADMLERLHAPIAKLGRLLLVEDAIQSLLENLDE